MKIIIYFAMLVLGAACYPPESRATDSQPTPSTVFTSTLAQHEIVFRFAEDGMYEMEKGLVDVKAEYFYRDIGRIITLVEIKDGWLVECRLTFQELDCNKPTGYWHIPDGVTRSTSQSFRAQWKANPDGKPIDVNLQQQQSPANSSASVWSELLGTGPTRLDRRSKRNGVRVGVLIDARSGASVPQLLTGYPRDLMERFNSQRRSQLVERVAARLENQSMNGGEEDTYDIQFQSPRWLVWGGTEDGYYGGAHGLYGYDFRVFDMTTGNPADARTALFRHLSNNDLDEFSDKYGIVEIPAFVLKKKKVIEALILEESRRVTRQDVPSASEQATGDQSRWDCFEEWQAESFGSSGDDLALKARKGHFGNGYRFPFDLMPHWKGLAVVSNDFAEANRGCRGVMFIIPWKRAMSLLIAPLYKTIH